MDNIIRIIGIDPGLNNTGWAVIDYNGNTLHFVASGTIKTKSSEVMAKRLNYIYKYLVEIMDCYRPHEASIEHVFVNKNPESSLKLGHARALALLAPAQYNIDIFEYSPNKVKKTVIGSGHATKDQIYKMVKILIPKANCDSSDAADALAIAICHAHNRNFVNYLAKVSL